MSDRVEEPTAHVGVVPLEEPISDAVVPLAVHSATRALLQVSSPTEARLTAMELVTDLGGSFVTSETDSGDIIPADLSFGDGEPLLAAAKPGTSSRLLLERYLSPYLLDARRVLELNVRTERLAESASTDTLTGLPNRRLIDRALGRLAGGDTVVILDLDHFKLINDQFGHAVGDEVLRAFGRVLRQTGRGRDLVGRFGGEEFVAVIDASGAGADAFLQRLKRTWAEHRPRPSTFSAGIARSVGDPDETIRLADEALYRAKSSGRDRWYWATAAGASTRDRPVDLVKPYLADAVLGKRKPAVRMAIDLLDNRVSSAMIVDELLAVAQREVGDRWQRNELTTVDEHLASGVAAAALDALTGEATRPSNGVLTVVTCAEGDWHSLAAQMFGESLRSYGVDVNVLGASTPTESVAEYLGRSGGDSLAISCSIPAFFPGAARLADAAHLQGIPVLMGGRAFGTDARRAKALGADAWAPSAREAAEILLDWKVDPPQVDRSPTELSAAGLRLSAAAEALGAEALVDLVFRFPEAADYEQRLLDSTRQDLVLVVQFLAAATLVDEPEIFIEFLTWLQELLLHRHLPTQALASGLEALAPLVVALAPGTGSLLESGQSWLASNQP